MDSVFIDGDFMETVFAICEIKVRVPGSLLGLVIGIALATSFDGWPKLRAFGRENLSAATASLSCAKDTKRKVLKRNRNKRRRTDARTPPSERGTARARSGTPGQQGVGTVESSKASTGVGAATPHRTTGTSRSEDQEKPRDRDEELEHTNRLEPVPKGKEWKDAPTQTTPPSIVNTEESSPPKGSKKANSRKSGAPPRRRKS